MNSVFTDSNAIIRYFAGDPAAEKLLEPVIYGSARGYTNSVVSSEVLFITIKLLTGRVAFELRDNPEMVKNALKMMAEQLYFIELEINEEVEQLAAATYRRYGIDTVATFDEDFERVPWLKVLP